MIFLCTRPGRNQFVSACKVYKLILEIIKECKVKYKQKLKNRLFVCFFSFLCTRVGKIVAVNIKFWFRTNRLTLLQYIKWILPKTFRICCLRKLCSSTKIFVTDLSSMTPEIFRLHLQQFETGMNVSLFWMNKMPTMFKSRKFSAEE